ncbi:envelope stress response membrane protein PspB [Gluconobacter sp. LMG 31484]|uniref:Envelope stress response membrane protein PspB n=1 Tax=Gluconobacter vitians TaxID=2728102 RepID=A0ABR9Y618_9PROT|nr:envelope stress response membrane protein PspB [Gluconobacter vitians]MBF0859136.1 envelope stress response membrane protein PspB [Gluconobacter vitians]
MNNFNTLALLLIFLPMVAIVANAAKSIAKQKSSPQQDPMLQAALTQAEAHATRLEERIDQLERILDEDIPGWRARNAR